MSTESIPIYGPRKGRTARNFLSTFSDLAKKSGTNDDADNIGVVAKVLDESSKLLKKRGIKDEKGIRKWLDGFTVDGEGVGWLYDSGAVTIIQDTSREGLPYRLALNKIEARVGDISVILTGSHEPVRYGMDNSTPLVVTTTDQLAKEVLPTAMGYVNIPNRPELLHLPKMLEVMEEENITTLQVESGLGWYCWHMLFFNYDPEQAHTKSVEGIGDIADISRYHKEAKFMLEGEFYHLYKAVSRALKDPETYHETSDVEAELMNAEYPTFAAHVVESGSSLRDAYQARAQQDNRLFVHPNPIMEASGVLIRQAEHHLGESADCMELVRIVKASQTGNGRERDTAYQRIRDNLGDFFLRTA